MRMLWLANPLARRREIYLRGKRLGNGTGGGAAERPGGEPSPPLASAASRRVGPCTRSVVGSWAELYRVARSSERERYARPRGPRKFAPANFWGEPASRLGAQRPSTHPAPSHHKG